MRFGRPFKLTMLDAPTIEIACQNCSCSSLLISTGKFLCQQAESPNYLRLEDPFNIIKGHLEKMAAGFLPSQPGQLVVPYLQVPG
jgi:hypothetical protein